MHHRVNCASPPRADLVSHVERLDFQANQAAKKPKMEGPAGDSAFQGPSLDALSGVASSLFPSTSSSDAEMTPLSSIAGPFVSYQHAGDQSKPCSYSQFSDPHPTDYTLVKHEHKAAGGSNAKHQQLATNAAPFSRPQKVLTLEKYREKHAAELALHNGIKEEASSDVCAPPPPLSSHHHKKRSQPQQVGHSSDGRRERSSSKKSRLPAPYGENGSATGEEIKMRIKVSSDRHGGSEHSGTLPVKDKHKEHGGHRHSKHGPSHVYALTGNSRGTIDNPSLLIRAHGNHLGDMSSSTTSRKRPHSDTGTHHYHHHHSSKRSNKGGLASSHYSTDGSQRMVDHHGHDGTNGLLTTNGQHTNYKDTFDILDSLLSAQGMNL